MRLFLPVLSAMLCVAMVALAEERVTTALGAVRLLPKEAASHLARIEAHDGRPAPERWHLLVHDSAAPNGLREYVVAGGEIVASRTISQFADSIAPEEAFGETVEIDSEQVIRLVQQYVQANGARLGTLDLELRKGGEPAAPLWRATCLDPAGRDLGQIVLSATKGTVLSHDGFAIAPSGKRGGKKQTRVIPAEPLPDGSREERKPARARSKQRGDTAPRVHEALAAPVRQAVPVRPESVQISSGSRD